MSQEAIRYTAKAFVANTDELNEGKLPETGKNCARYTHANRDGVVPSADMDDGERRRRWEAADLGRGQDRRRAVGVHRVAGAPEPEQNMNRCA
jgi:hypothetical protein